MFNDAEDGFDATQETQPQSQTQPQTQSGSQDSDVDSTKYWGFLDPRSQDAPLFRLEHGKHTYIIGRGAKCDIQLKGSHISGVHAMIKYFPEKAKASSVTIVDQSRNGTFIRGYRIPVQHTYVINSGDDLAFGAPTKEQDPSLPSFQFTFRLVPKRGAKTVVEAKYDMAMELGHGTFATVYKGLHRATGNFFAIKVIKTKLDTSNKMIERETDILRELRHPNIVQLHEVIHDDEERTINLVMEYVTGGDLFDYINRNGRIQEHLAASLTTQMCGAMAYIHRKGITHRDLKPENILLTTDTPPVVKVADFGLAKCVTNNTILKTMCGTPNYLAPEVVLQRNQSGYDSKVDSWSIGVIVFAMMTVSSPFPDEDQEQPLTERVKRRCPMWDILDHAGAGYQAKAFVASLLEFNPVKRISMEEALDDPWLFPQFSQGSRGMLQQYFGGVDSPQASQGFEHLAGDYSVSNQLGNLEIDSPVDFTDPKVGGSSAFARTMPHEAEASEVENGSPWTMVEEEDADKTPMAKPAPLPPAPLPLRRSTRNSQRKRKYEEGATPESSKDGSDIVMQGQIASEVDNKAKARAGVATRSSMRKVGKANAADSPVNARKDSPAAGNGRTPSGRRGVTRGGAKGKGKMPVTRDFAED